MVALHGLASVRGVMSVVTVLVGLSDVVAMATGVLVVAMVPLVGGASRPPIFPVPWVVLPGRPVVGVPVVM